jgi:iron(III) transport system substrate-binding protein
MMLHRTGKTWNRAWLVTVRIVAVLVVSAVAAPAFASELLFYSSVPRNLTEALIKGFHSKYPDIQVKLFQAGTETVLQKIELETKGNGYPAADVMWIQEQSAMSRLADEGLLEPYTPAGAEFIDDKYKDAKDRWIGTFVTHVLIMYNKKAFDNQQPPKSWQELADPRFRNKVTLANPRVSGTGAAVIAALSQNLGWDYIEKLAANKPQIASGHPAMVSTVIAGERIIGPMQDLSIYEAVAKNQPIRFVFPTEGAIAVPALAALTSHSKNKAEARKFMDYFVSQDAATLLRNNGMYHTRKDAKPPEGWPPIADIKTLPFDWKRYEAGKEKMKDRFSDLVER